MTMTTFATVLALLLAVASASPLQPELRIINGQLAAHNQFPWHVSIQGRLNNNQQTLCGGALIGPAHVLTAANCVVGFDYRYFTIGFGSTNISRPVVQMEVNPNIFNTRIVHPQYNPQTFANNIALIRLPINITTATPFLSQIRLPTLGQAGTTFVNNIAQISGFGRINDQSLPSEVLRFARQRVITQNECANIFGSAFANVNTLCTFGADFNQQGPCGNDNGGPLVLQENNGQTLIGVQSFISNQGCNAGHPAGYVRLGPFVQWISQNAGIATRR